MNSGDIEDKDDNGMGVVSTFNRVPHGHNLILHSRLSPNVGCLIPDADRRKERQKEASALGECGTRSSVHGQHLWDKEEPCKM